MAHEGMVDALREATRVLSPGCVLVDLRPLHARNCPIELVTTERAIPVGAVDASGSVADDLAADRAVGQCVEDGSLLPSRKQCFPFELYWDSVDEMAAFMRQSTRMRRVRPGYPDLEKAHRAWKATDGAGVRIRATRPMSLGVYRRARCADARERGGRE